MAPVSAGLTHRRQPIHFSALIGAGPGLCIPGLGIVLQNMGFILIAEIAQGVRTGFGAVCPRPHMEAFFTALANSSSSSRSSGLPLPSVISSQNVVHLVCTEPAGNALAAGFFGKVQEVAGRSTMQVSSSTTTSLPEPIIAPAAVRSRSLPANPGVLREYNRRKDRRFEPL